MAAKLRRILHFSGILAVFLLSVELTARLDDWIHLGVPLSASPNLDQDLMVAEPWGVRGRSNGSYRKWKLNQFGFRGPEIDRQPRPDQYRIMILGASETFGLRESPDKEYPAQLRQKLEEKGAFEVVNAALPGMTLPSMIVFWDNWAVGFSSKIALIYPSPLFYLDAKTPGREPAVAATSSPAETRFRLRTVDRAVDVYRSMPMWVRSLREDWVLQKALAEKGPDWVFSEVPKDRLKAFEADMVELIQHVRKQGAEPVLVTHAMSATSPPRPEDLAQLHAFRVFFPRATEATMAAFDKSANRILIDIARKENVQVIDADKVLGGHAEWFGDLVHFNDAGAAKIAELLAGELLMRPDLQRP